MGVCAEGLGFRGSGFKARTFVPVKLVNLLIGGEEKHGGGASGLRAPCGLSRRKAWRVALPVQHELRSHMPPVDEILKLLAYVPRRKPHTLVVQGRMHQ